MSDGGYRPVDQPDQLLEHAAEVRREAEGLRARLDAAADYAEGTAARVRQAEAAYAREDEDVTRLESLSWSRILSTLKGSHATDVERESAERDAARYRLADAETRDQLARRDVAALRVQLDALGDVDRLWADALAAKEAWAGHHDPATAATLAEIGTRRGALRAEDREAREAHEAGRSAHEHLARAARLLGGARSWSAWDTFGGGGMFTDMMKYDKLDQVAAELRRADAALVRFSRELADLRLGGVEAVNLDSSTRAFDVFFDNIFSDLRVLSRIQEAEARVARALAHVEQVLGDLAERGAAIEAELGELDRRREQVLVGGGPGAG